MKFNLVVSLKKSAIHASGADPTEGKRGGKGVGGGSRRGNGGNNRERRGGGGGELSLMKP